MEADDDTRGLIKMAGIGLAIVLMVAGGLYFTRPPQPIQAPFPPPAAEPIQWAVAPELSGKL